MLEVYTNIKNARKLRDPKRRSKRKRRLSVKLKFYKLPRNCPVVGCNAYCWGFSFSLTVYFCFLFNRCHAVSIPCVVRFFRIL